LAEGFIGDDVINELLIVRFLAAGDRADGIASFSAMTTVTDSSGNTTSGICSLDLSPPISLSFRLASCHLHLDSSSSSQFLCPKFKVAAQEWTNRKRAFVRLLRRYILI